jgi:acyl-CoA dehydrogenase
MLILGGNLKRKERTSARLGDMLSELYLASSVLKYFADQGKPSSDIDYVKWCLQMCLHRLQVACDDLLHNFPIRWLGTLFRWIIFPYGTAYQKPRDSLYHKIVTQMIQPSAIRNRLTQYCFIDQSPTDSMRRIELALEQMDEIEPIWKKFQKALRSGKLSSRNSFEDNLGIAVNTNLLTDNEAYRLREFHKLHNEVIRVDEFNFDLSEVVN